MQIYIYLSVYHSYTRDNVALCVCVCNVRVCALMFAQKALLLLLSYPSKRNA